MKKVLVLGNVGTQGQSLAVLRSLGRGNVEVHRAWYNPGCVSLRSRYLSKTHELPAICDTDDRWKTALSALMQREQFDLVMPLSDVETLACHHHRDELSKLGRIYIPNAEACEVLFDKMKTNDLARSVGLHVPREIVATEAQAAPEILAELGLPLVLKPRRTFGSTVPESFPKVQKAYSAEEFKRLLPQMLAFGPVSVQENFIGLGAGIELLLNAGEPLLAFQHVRVHEPLHGGQSAYRKSAPPLPALLRAAVQLLRAVKYHGVAMVEFKLNPATGQWIFIEVNARFWGSLPLAVASGANFPLALYQFLIEGRTSFPQSYRNGIHCRNLTLDLEWQLANLWADRSDPTLATQPLYRVVADPLVNLLLLRERIDTLALDDPVPFLAECWKLTRRFASRLGKLFRRHPRPAYLLSAPVNAPQKTVAS